MATKKNKRVCKCHTNRPTPKQIGTLVETHGSITAAARHLKVPRKTFSNWHAAAVSEGLAQKSTAVGTLTRKEQKASLVDGRIRVQVSELAPIPSRGHVVRYISTSAQNNTELHNSFWNMRALAEHLDAEMLVARYTYNKQMYGNNSVKPGTKKASDYYNLWYPDEIKPFIADHHIQLAPGLMWCGEINILPTAARPLSGFETYTGRLSGIFPHAKFAMESIASGKYEPTKFNWTTGTCTKRNYIQKKAGLKAEHHHGYGGLLIEVDHHGNWWVWQLNADDTGTIYHHDLCAKDGKVTGGHRVESINWGDIHSWSLDPEVQRLGWEGSDSMIEVLRPKFQFMHDTVDFRFRNHHDRKNPHKQFLKHVRGEENVALELAHAAEFLNWSHRPWCKTVVVDSNHDRAFERWLCEADYRHDPINAEIFLEAQLETYQQIRAGTYNNFHHIEWALRKFGAHRNIKFLREDESFVICRNKQGGIETGMHGYNGPNGAHGAPLGFAKMGRRANIGDKHSAGIFDGIYVAGMSGNLDQGYNKGPSSWSPSHIITYPNSKRSIATMWGGGWRRTA